MRKQYETIYYDTKIKGESYRVKWVRPIRDTGGMSVPTNLLMNGTPKIHKDNVKFYSMLPVDKPLVGKH